jgi:hypothetical protein
MLLVEAPQFVTIPSFAKVFASHSPKAESGG